MINNKKPVKEHRSAFGGQVRLRRKGGTQNISISESGHPANPSLLSGSYGILYDFLIRLLLKIATYMREKK